MYDFFTKEKSMNRVVALVGTVLIAFGIVSCGSSKNFNATDQGWTEISALPEVRTTEISKQEFNPHVDGARRRVKRTLVSGDKLEYDDVQGLAVISGDVVIGTTKEMERKEAEFTKKYVESGGKTPLKPLGTSIRQTCTSWIVYGWWCGWTINWKSMDNPAKNTSLF
jgi:hypothetical protein